MKARILINETANDGNYSKSFLIKIARMGASIVVYPESGADGDPIDMDTDEGFFFIKNYNGK